MLMRRMCVGRFATDWIADVAGDDDEARHSKCSTCDSEVLCPPEV